MKRRMYFYCALIASCIGIGSTFVTTKAGQKTDTPGYPELLSEPNTQAALSREQAENALQAEIVASIERLKEKGSKVLGLSGAPASKPSATATNTSPRSPSQEALDAAWAKNQSWGHYLSERLQAGWASFKAWLDSWR